MKGDDMRLVVFHTLQTYTFDLYWIAFKTVLSFDTVLTNYKRGIFLPYNFSV